VTSIQRAGHSNWLLAGITGLAVIALVFSAVVFEKEISDNQRQQMQQHEQSVALERALDAQVQCIRKWAVETASSNAIVRNASNGRNVALTRDLFALDALVRGAILRRSAASLAILSHRYLSAARGFERADATYQAALRRYPVLSPTLACTVTLRPVPVPTRTATRTVTPPRATVHVPGPTVTRPGPTQTRTATVTVTAPPGKGHRR